jgi:hypothetical protein
MFMSNFKLFCINCNSFEEVHIYPDKESIEFHCDQCNCWENISSNITDCSPNFKVRWREGKFNVRNKR